jgi:hypothetical protein
VMMVWSGRYHKGFATKIPRWSGKPVLIIIGMIAIFIIGLGMAENLKLLSL